MTDFRALCVELTQQLDDVLDFTVSSETRRYMKALVVRARTALAHPAPPAEGEVGELVELLRFEANTDDAIDHTHWLTADQMHRAADLLEQRHPVPVPVSERMPGPEDCDAEGRCWLLTVEDEYPQWRLHSIEGNQPGGATMIWVPVDSSPGVMVDCFYTSHWLPAYALPLPAGEVE